MFLHVKSVRSYVVMMHKLQKLDLSVGSQRMDDGVEWSDKLLDGHHLARDTVFGGATRQT